MTGDDFGPRFGDRAMWIFTLGQPEADLLDMLAEALRMGGPTWVVIPVTLPSGIDSFPFIPEGGYRAAF